MALEARLLQKLQQKLVMTPQLRLAIKILQLQREELDTMIEEELAENPVLERAEGETPIPEEPPMVGDGDTPVAVTDAPQQEDMNWESYFDSYNEGTPSLPATGGDDDDDDRQRSLENRMVRTESLAEHLTEQLRFHDLSEDEERVASVIIGNLNSSGYCELPLEELAASAGVGIELVAYVLQLIQGCDPIGIGARDLRECLLMQLRAQALEEPRVEDPALTLATRIVHDHLDMLESHRFDRLAKELGVTMDEVSLAMKIIVALEPKPARNFVEEEVRYVIPDVHIHKLGEEYVITLNEEGLPRLRVSQSYRRMLAEGGAAKEYLNDKLRSAAWLIKSIQQRQRTLYLVAESIVKFQQDFLTYGVSRMHPLVLRDVAADVGVHESTVSRAVANKYMATPRGIFAMKKFFTTGLKGQPGEDVAAESVKDKIREMIANEDAAHPLSDEEIAQALSRGNVTIARRTVAKYRESLNILSSAKRKHALQ
ncbi:MAG: RNA polymerase factor sigma-54 [Deltaproteobacteria bacterium]|nr:RNA polymerase factor sigma-54 [Deltaproteobacteria bacterium]